LEVNKFGFFVDGRAMETKLRRQLTRSAVLPFVTELLERDCFVAVDCAFML
jgi:hypothetical protein